MVSEAGLKSHFVGGCRSNRSLGGTEGKGRTFPGRGYSTGKGRDVKRTCVLKIKKQVKVGEAGCEPVR